MTYELNSLPEHVLPAEYRPAALPEHAGNPLIEALPPFLTADDLMPYLGRYPDFVKKDSSLPKTQRMMAVSRLNSYLEPMTCHYEVIEQIGLMIRSGYTDRNPVSADYRKSLVKFYRQSMNGRTCPIELSGPSTAPSFSLFGVSGTGKSTIVDRTLSFLPRAMVHPKYGFTQIVWMKLDCPMDGSLKSLLLAIVDNIDTTLGTSHAKVIGRRATVDDLILSVSKIAAQHHLGVLVVDEIQNLLDAPGFHQAKMLNFFVTLANVVKIPFIVLGTPRAQKLLQGVLREARRLSDSGSLTWDRMSPGDEWDYFLGELWKYQWTSKHAELDEALSKTMYSQTQGIKALVVRLFQLSQLQAMRDNSETLTVALINKVASEKFVLLTKVLTALRNGNREEIIKYEDLLSTGLTGLMADIGESTGAADNVAKSELRKGRFDKLKAISKLMREGCAQEDAQSIADAIFDQSGEQKAVREKILDTIESERPASLIEAYKVSHQDTADTSRTPRPAKKAGKRRRG